MNLFLKNTYFYQNFNKYLKKAILTKKVLLFNVQKVKTSLKFFQNNIKDYIGYFFFEDSGTLTISSSTIHTLLLSEPK